MYLTTTSSYLSNPTDSLSKKKQKNKKISKSSNDDLQQTRYVNIDDIMGKNKESEQKNAKTSQLVFKNEFPIASVILTIIFTIMVMMLAFGLGNI